MEVRDSVFEKGHKIILSAKVESFLSIHVPTFHISNILLDEGR